MTRPLPLALFGWTSLLALASCVNVLGLDGYAGAGATLCDLLESCYGGDLYPDCHERLEARLAEADPQARQAYLELFSSAECTVSCTKARKCLDANPLCDGAGLSCAGPEQCCGFSAGKAQCSGSTCCVPLGAECSEDTPCCADSCVDGRCGGSVCQEEGQGCGEGEDCCPGLRCHAALGFTCQLCQPKGGPCETEDDCCETACIDNVCQDAATCGVLGDACTATEPCCAPLGCGSHNSDTKTCCHAAGTACSDSTTCCSGTCNEFSGNTFCCNATGTCKGDAECCTGECASIAPNVSTLACCVPEGECPNPCLTGTDPIHPQCGIDGSGPGTAAAACLNEICADNPACCCQAWSEDCALAFAQKCPTFCSQL